jgi:MFS family permease
VLTIVLSVIPVGFCLGAAEVAFPAFGDALGDNALAGPLIALWSLGSFIGGLAYGAYGHRLGAVRAFEWGVIALPLTTLPLALASSFAVMVPLALLAGAAVAPMLAAANQLIGEVAPREAQTEAYTWPTTAIVTGVTVGNAASGAIIEIQDWSAAFVMAAVVGATGFFVVMARRGTFESARAQA